MARPRIVMLAPSLSWIEFPIGILVVALTLTFALRAPREERAALRDEWRRHAQVVRVLPDPELARLEDTLSSWLEGGADAEGAALIIARLTDTSLDEARATVMRATSRRDRLKLLHAATHATRI